MVSRITQSGIVAAIMAAAMLAVSTVHSTAFTLNAPSLVHPAVSAGVEPVWWDTWGNWHPNWWGPHPYYYYPYHQHHHYYYYRHYYYYYPHHHHYHHRHHYYYY